MTTRIVREKDTNRIKVVESDDRSESHEHLHRDLDLGYKMRKNRIEKITGASGYDIKNDISQYDREREKSNDTRYSESDRRKAKQKAEELENEYGW